MAAGADIVLHDVIAVLPEVAHGPVVHPVQRRGGGQTGDGDLEAVEAHVVEPRAGHDLRLADGLDLRGVVPTPGGPGRAVQAAAGDVQGQGLAVDADEAPARALGGLEGGAAAREGVQHPLPRPGGAAHDAVQQRQGLLGVVAGALRVLLLEVAQVVPHVAGGHGIVVIISVGLAAHLDGAVGAPVGVHVPPHVVVPGRAGRGLHGVQVEVVALGLRVEQDHVVLAAEVARAAAPGLVHPDQLVQELLLAEDLVQQQPQVGVEPVVHVHEDHALLGQQLTAQRKHPPHVPEIRLPVPGIGEGLHLHRAAAAPPALLPHPDAHVELVSGEIGRVHVNHLDLPGVFRQQRLQRPGGVAQVKRAPPVLPRVELRVDVYPLRPHERTSYGDNITCTGSARTRSPGCSPPGSRCRASRPGR